MRPIGDTILHWNLKIEVNVVNIPYEMQEATEKLLEKRSISKIRDCVFSICERYNNESGQGKVLVKTPEEAVSYAISRMPGTFGAVKSAVCAFKEALEPFFEAHPEALPKTLADIGAGTGAAVWAVASEFELSHITCFERESSMTEIGKHMLSYGNKVMKNAAWVQGDVIGGNTEKADLVTASYIMNELKPSDRDAFLNNLFETSDGAVILLEPGTRAGFKNILYARDFFTKKGAIVVAPCTHSSACPLPADDWCHFSCRMQRSKTQKFVKGGDAPYEDEKFAYLAVLIPGDGVMGSFFDTRGRGCGLIFDDMTAEAAEEGYARIIRHPQINKGFVELKLCSGKGIETVKVTSRDKARFKAARKAEWGDRI